LDEIRPLLDTVQGMEPDATGWHPGRVFRFAATYLDRSGHPEEARALAERALDWVSARSPDGYVHERTRILSFLLGRPGDALALLESLVEEYPESVPFHGRLGVALALTEDREGAEAEATWLEELDSPYLFGENTYWRAAILANLGRKDEAVLLLRRAYQEGRSRYDISADLFFKPIWGYEPYEAVVAPRG
jgi:tetratricopeptide (TPR) repeat protein